MLLSETAKRVSYCGRNSTTHELEEILSSRLGYRLNNEGVLSNLEETLQVEEREGDLQSIEDTTELLYGSRNVEEVARSFFKEKEIYTMWVSSKDGIYDSYILSAEDKKRVSLCYIYEETMILLDDGDGGRGVLLALSRPTSQGVLKDNMIFQGKDKPETDKPDRLKESKPIIRLDELETLAILSTFYEECVSFWEKEKEKNGSRYQEEIDVKKAALQDVAKLRKTPYCPSGQKHLDADTVKEWVYYKNVKNLVDDFIGDIDTKFGLDEHAHALNSDIRQLVHKNLTSFREKHSIK